MPIHLNWQEIDTVVLDLDGTLIDLAFERYFWQEVVPLALSTQRAISVHEAHLFIMQQYQKVLHTLAGYSVEYWSEQLDLDIHQLIKKSAHHISVRDDTLPFLQALRRHGYQTILLTNSHPDNLAVKLQHTQLDQHIDHLFSSHQYLFPKEDPKLWQALRKDIHFDPQRTLFIDDVECMLDTAYHFGIKYCVGVKNPDSCVAMQTFMRYPALHDYRLLLPAIEGKAPLNNRVNQEPI